MWSFVIGALAGGIAGAIITPQTFTSYDQGGLIGFKGFSAAMLGGIGNLYGALLGGLVLGLLETFGLDPAGRTNPGWRCERRAAATCCLED